MADAPIPIFDPSSVKTALMFKKASGKLKRLRKPPKTPPSRAPETEYFMRLNRLIKELQQLVQTMVVENIPAIVANAPVEIREPVRQDVGEVLEETMRNLRIAFAARAPLETIARSAGENAEARNAKEQKRVVQTVLGIRPEIGEPWLADMMKQFTKENAQLVGRVSDDFIDRLERKIGNRVREGIRAEDIAKEITRDFVRNEGLEVTKAKKRAKLIARDQVASLQADVTRVRQQRIGVQRYVWRTSEDERVRESHSERNGLVFEWNRPIEEQLGEKGLEPDAIDGHPGKPINCRCYAEPVLSDIVPDAPEI